MLASNLTLGFYIRFMQPEPHNSSALMTNDTHEVLAHTTSGITILPLLATMCFIIGT